MPHGVPNFITLLTMAIEIEKKFLVKGPFKQDAYETIHICQGYICTGHGKTVRIRITDNTAYITIKGPSHDNGLSRYEWEKEIPVNEAEELMELCEPEIIDKHRYLIKAGLYTYEVDEFHGDNNGLIIAEIELPDEHTPFERTKWLGKEVTGDRRYYNSMLTINPYKNWK